MANSSLSQIHHIGKNMWLPYRGQLSSKFKGKAAHKLVRAQNQVLCLYNSGEWNKIRLCWFCGENLELALLGSILRWFQPSYTNYANMLNCSTYEERNELSLHQLVLLRKEKKSLQVNKPSSRHCSQQLWVRLWLLSFSVLVKIWYRHLGMKKYQLRTLHYYITEARKHCNIYSNCVWMLFLKQVGIYLCNF